MFAVRTEEELFAEPLVRADRFAGLTRGAGARVLSGRTARAGGHGAALCTA